MRAVGWILFAIVIAIGVGGAVVSWQQHRHFDSWVRYQQAVDEQLSDLRVELAATQTSLSTTADQHLADLARIDELVAELAAVGDEDAQQNALDRTWRGSVLEAVTVIDLHQQCIALWNEIEPALRTPDRFDPDSIQTVQNRLDDVCGQAGDAQQRWLDSVR